MFDALFAPPRINRVVEAGAVHCPVRMRAVSLDQCQACGFLQEQRSSDEGQEITCSPSFAALIGAGEA